MQNLQITAYLSSPIAVYDDWTPQLEGVLIYQFLSNLGLSSPNPTPAQVAETKEILDKNFPIKKHLEHGFYYCSSPVYSYKEEQQSRTRKRWTPDQDGHINWGKRKAKFSTSEGAEKSYDLPLFLRLTPRIDWFCVGNPVEIKNLLNYITGLGKKRAQGFGQVYSWKITEIEEDWSILRDNELMKPLPNYICKELGVNRFYNLIQWGWKPPAWLNENKTLCMMPEVVKQC
jgi:hypothetical protein